MSLPKRICVVRLTDDALDDLHRLQKKDPETVRSIFKKLLLLERSANAGEPLLGALVGFRKLVAGNRDWRIAWRVVEHAEGSPILDISEVWAAGARTDNEVSEELKKRVEKLKTHSSQKTHPLAQVLEQIGRHYATIKAPNEPQRSASLPGWLSSALSTELHLTDAEISVLSIQESQSLLTEHWARQR